MSAFTVSKKRLQAGIWEGEITAEPGHQGEPSIDVRHDGMTVPSFAVTRNDDAQAWQLRIAIPPDLLSDGIQTFLIIDRDSEETLSSFSILAGEPLDEDIRAEVDLLRAELDLLKRAFRRHCAEDG